MKNKMVTLLLILCLVMMSPGTVFAVAPSNEIVVLYTNDVHCAVDDNIGYAGLAAYKAEMETMYGADKVTLVDLGDAVQGAAIGTLSKGEFIVEIMNEVGYDVITLGNHEFDYGLVQALKLMELQKAAVVSSNFTDLMKKALVYDAYKIIDYGHAQVAYVGISTPETFTKSTPTYFQDGEGNYIYGFREDGTGAALYSAVQAAIDAAVAEGADYVVALGHLGDEVDSQPWRSADVIANTTGIDVFLDGHAHSIIEGESITNKIGEKVVLASSGTKLASIGKLVISADGRITTELISEYETKDAKVTAFIEEIKTAFEDVLKTVVAKTDVPLTVNNPVTGKRIVRNAETNLGNLCADAYRSMMGSDIAFVNGGGVRANIEAGDITYEQIIAVHPFGNMATVVEATGQEILDALEMGARSAPGENGGFLQVSGITFKIDTTMESSVIVDEKKNFVKVDGPYRVTEVLVQSEALDLAKTYKLASHNYMLKSGGDGINMFMDNVILQDEVMIDNQVLINYIVDKLQGVVGTEYADPFGDGRIAIRHNPFKDDAKGSWYYDSVVYAASNDIMGGMSEIEFMPNAAMSRAMFATVLYRQAGSPQIEGKVSDIFTDCADDSWYSDAIVWAVDQGIATGITKTTFQPNAALSRQELARFLYGYIKSQGEGFSGSWMFLLEYADRTEIHDVAYEAVAYCVMNDWMVGISADRFDPLGTATRAMGAAVMQKLDILE